MPSSCATRRLAKYLRAVREANARLEITDDEVIALIKSQPPHFNTAIIIDNCTGASVGINGRTPDTLDTPATTWIDSGNHGE